MTNIEESMLPHLREELTIQRGAPLLSGAPSWVIYDPVRHRFFQVGQRAFYMIALWSTGTREALKANMRAERLVELRDEEIDGLVSFLSKNELIEGGTRGVSHRMARVSQRAGLLGKLQKHVFFKVPLVRPQSFLEATLPFVRFLLTRGFVIGTLILLCLDLYLLGRLWSEALEYSRAALASASLGVFLVAVVFVKIIHELGHAYQSVSRGLKVPVMGVAFLVILPLMYSDITDAWKLRRRRDRIFVDAGGVLAELSLAVYATLFWCFLPDGMLRTSAFAVGTTSWVFSLFVNLNPFMRFDGYYFLCDAIGFANLQPRSFKYTRWAIRELLFGFDDKPPESFSPRRARFVIVYAVLTWIYRFFIFLGIALLVYSFVFKALGALLFAALIFHFFVRPLLVEFREWMSMSDRIFGNRRTYVSATLIGVAVALLFTPHASRVAVPALLEMDAQQVVFPPEPARLAEVLIEDGSSVVVGEPIFQFENPELPARISDAETRVRMLEARLLSGAGDAVERVDSGVTKRRLDEAVQALSALIDSQDNLTVTAPISGRVTDLSDDAIPGTWMGRRRPLLRIVGGDRLVVRGLIGEAELNRIDPLREAVFVPDNLLIERLELMPPDTSEIAIDVLPDPYFASIHGGAVEVVPREDSTLVPQQVWYPMEAHVVDPDRVKYSPKKAERGQVFLHTEPESIATRVFRRVAQVLIRELSF